jgi:hypothetical protein
MSKNDVITYRVDPPPNVMHDPAERAPLPPKVEPRRAAADALPTGGGAVSGISDQ